MRVTAEIRYAGVGPSAVFEMLSDTAFQERKCEATGAVEYDVNVTGFDDGGATITTRRHLPTDQVPDLVKTFVGSTVLVVQVDDWAPAKADGSRDGTIGVEISGAPVKLTGTQRLTDDGAGGTVQYVDGDLKASVPLIGGKIERAAEPAIRAAIRVEERTGHAWLHDRD